MCPRRIAVKLPGLRAKDRTPVIQDDKHTGPIAAGLADRDPAEGAGWLRGRIARWRPASPILMLFLIGAGSVFALIFFGGVSLDREAAEASRQEMATQIAERAKSLEWVSHDYAWWDEAVENLAVQFSLEWTRDNLGPQTISASYPQITGALLLDDANHVQYGYFGSLELTPQAPLQTTGGIDRLAEQARGVTTGNGPTPVHAMLNVGGTIYLAAASAVTPVQPSDVVMRSHPVLVLMTALDTATLDEMCMATRVDGLRTAPAIGAGEVGQALVGADGTTLGYLAWVPPEPGQHLIRRLIIPILLVTVLLAVLAVIAVDQILSARRIAEINARLLAAKNESVQQAANLLGITVESIDEGIVVMRNDGEMRHWNHTYERMWRFPPGILRVGMKLQELIEWKLKHGGFQIVDDEVEEGDPVSLVPEPSHRKLYRDADGRLIESRRFQMPDGQGQIGVTRDLTQAKRREQALIEAREQALIANRSKSEFLANVSHELRTPLNAIIGFSEVLEVELYGAIENERYRSYIRDIRKSGLHLLSLINDILDFSKIEAGKMDLRLEVCDCSAIVKDALRQISHQAGEQGLTIDVDLPATPVTIIADSRALFRGLLNLLSNAVKFTPAGGRVEVGYRMVEEGSVAFTVRDTGIGIAEADIATALSPFGQIDSDMARRYRGTGLGLSIVKGIADLHHGTLDIVSQVGIGTTITLVIPDHRQRVLRLLKTAPRESEAVASEAVAS
jgi:signal transduction histidine kinase/sensor domain CHASE-containing protein